MATRAGRKVEARKTPRDHLSFFSEKRATFARYFNPIDANDEKTAPSLESRYTMSRSFFQACISSGQSVDTYANQLYWELTDTNREGRRRFDGRARRLDVESTYFKKAMLNHLEILRDHADDHKLHAEAEIIADTVDRISSLPIAGQATTRERRDVLRSFWDLVDGPMATLSDAFITLDSSKPQEALLRTTIALRNYVYAFLIGHAVARASDRATTLHGLSYLLLLYHHLGQDDLIQDLPA